MKKVHIITTILHFLLAVAFLVPGAALCAGATAESEAAAKAVNSFAIDLYGKLRKPEGNLVFSPYSVSMALAMAYSGARGKTESQIANAMRLSLKQPQVGEAFGALSSQILAAAQGKNVEINIANALWADKSYPFLKEFLEHIRANYSTHHGWISHVPLVKQLVGFVAGNDEGPIRQLDFQRYPESSRRTINSWVEEQTRNKIKDLLPPGVISGDTRLVLTNAIYFKGIWASQFKKGWTKEAPFTLLNGKEVRVPMMTQEKSFGYAEEPDLQLLEMPYKGEELAMVVLLPSKKKRLEDFENSLTSEWLDKLIAKLRTITVEVFLPKFKMTLEFPLRAALIDLGIRDAFSAADADFSGMTGNKDLFISKGIHKAFVETNEEGTEAAAATSLLMTKKGEPAPLRVFLADHPFLFLIRHKPSNCILFIGRVTNP